MINTSSNPVAAWLLEHNLPHDSPLDQDLNGDGVSLLMAYALNLNPRENLTGRLPEARLNSDTLSISYYAGSAGVSYQVETSKDLMNWEITGVVTSTPGTNGILTSYVARDEKCGFLRLVVTEDEE